MVCNSSMNRMTWPSCFRQVVENGFQPLLEFPAEFRTGDERAQVE